MKNKTALITTIIAAIFVIIFFDKIINFVINVQWFKEVGYISVYFTKLIAILKLMVPLFLVSYIAIWIYYKSLRGSIIKYSKVITISDSYKSIERKIFIILNAIISFTISYLFASKYWYTILQFNNASKFNSVDPIFNKDISFYIFKLPLIESLYGTVMGLLVLLVVITLVIFFMLNARDRMFTSEIVRPINRVNVMKSGITKFAGKQLAIVSSLILVLLSLGYLIKSWNLVYSPRGVVFGASYTDVRVSLIFYRVISVVSIIAAVVIFISVIKSKVKPIIVSVILIVVLIIGENVAAGVTQRLFVKSNEKSFEQKYINYNIENTRKAYNIDIAEEKQFNVKDNLTKEGIGNNRSTLDNVKINSFVPAGEFYNQVQVIRPYYTFNDIDVDRYSINGKYNQVFLSPREITLESLEHDTWQNRHLTYTHGYGLVMSKVNSVTSEGQPDFVIRDIPSENSTDIDLTNPRIYFGEKTNDYAIVATNVDEFDYPVGGSNKSNSYEGKAGINMSFVNKLLFAVNKRDANFLLSRAVNSDSKILINRNIVERVEKIAPFLNYDKDPYIFISNGKLYWIIDAYTTSNRYPFSTPQGDINYIRNSVKVVIDAVDGTTDFYQMDKNDPIANSYSKIFPKLFKNIDTLPKEIRNHFRYPEDLFTLQANVLEKYHVTKYDVFYNSEDQWGITRKLKEIDGEKAISDPSYVVMKLPESDKEEMLLVNYFTMKNNDNMVAMFGARMDGDNYGKLVLYRFPSSKTVYSPYLFQQRLKQDTFISKEISLWNAQGSKIMLGDISILPIDNSLLYIEPLYLRASGKNSIPEMKRVVVSYGDRTVLAENISLALEQLFNVSEVKPQNVIADNKNATNNEKLKEAKDLYDKALEAQKSGDWAKYGEYINKLGEVINSLNK